MMKKFFISLLLLTVVFFAFADDDYEYVSLSTLDGVDITLDMPETSFVKATAKKLVSCDNAFTMVVNNFIEYPESWSWMSREDKLLEVFNILNQISTQEGLTYISRTAGYKPKVLFEESYRIDKPSKSSPALDDLSFSSVPEKMRIFAYQKDNRFGGNVYAVDYYSAPSEVFMSLVNCTDMKFMGVPCLKANELCMYVDVYLGSDGIYLTAMASVFDKKPKINLLVYTIDLRSSFERRITALSEWFTDLVK